MIPPIKQVGTKIIKEKNIKLGNKRIYPSFLFLQTKTRNSSDAEANFCNASVKPGA
jgi:hypothetical protein